MRQHPSTTTMTQPHSPQFPPLPRSSSDPSSFESDLSPGGTGGGRESKSSATGGGGGMIGSGIEGEGDDTRKGKAKALLHGGEDEGSLKRFHKSSSILSSSLPSSSSSVVVVPKPFSSLSSNPDLDLNNSSSNPIINPSSNPGPNPNPNLNPNPKQISSLNPESILSPPVSKAAQTIAWPFPFPSSTSTSTSINSMESSFSNRGGGGGFFDPTVGTSLKEEDRFGFDVKSSMTTTTTTGGAGSGDGGGENLTLSFVKGKTKNDEVKKGLRNASGSLTGTGRSKTGSLRSVGSVSSGSSGGGGGGNGKRKRDDRHGSSSKGHSSVKNTLPHSAAAESTPPSDGGGGDGGIGEGNVIESGGRYDHPQYGAGEPFSLERDRDRMGIIPAVGSGGGPGRDHHRHSSHHPRDHHHRGSGGGDGVGSNRGSESISSSLNTHLTRGSEASASVTGSLTGSGSGSGSGGSVRESTYEEGFGSGSGRESNRGSTSGSDVESTKKGDENAAVASGGGAMTGVVVGNGQGDDGIGAFNDLIPSTTAAATTKDVDGDRRRSPSSGIDLSTGSEESISDDSLVDEVGQSGVEISSSTRESSQKVASESPSPHLQPPSSSSAPPPPPPLEGSNKKDRKDPSTSAKSKSIEEVLTQVPKLSPFGLSVEVLPELLKATNVKVPFLILDLRQPSQFNLPQAAMLISKAAGGGKGRKKNVVGISYNLALPSTLLRRAGYGLEKVLLELPNFVSEEEEEGTRNNVRDNNGNEEEGNSTSPSPKWSGVIVIDERGDQAICEGLLKKFLVAAVYETGKKPYRWGEWFLWVRGGWGGIEGKWPSFDVDDDGEWIVKGDAKALVQEAFDRALELGSGHEEVERERMLEGESNLGIGADSGKPPTTTITNSESANGGGGGGHWYNSSSPGSGGSAMDAGADADADAYSDEPMSVSSSPPNSSPEPHPNSAQGYTGSKPSQQQQQRTGGTHPREPKIHHQHRHHQHHHHHHHHHRPHYHHHDDQPRPESSASEDEKMDFVANLPSALTPSVPLERTSAYVSSMADLNSSSTNSEKTPIANPTTAGLTSPRSLLSTLIPVPSYPPHPLMSTKHKSAAGVKASTPKQPTATPSTPPVAATQLSTPALQALTTDPRMQVSSSGIASSSPMGMRVSEDDGPFPSGGISGNGKSTEAGGVWQRREVSGSSKDPHTFGGGGDDKGRPPINCEIPSPPQSDNSASSSSNSGSDVPAPKRLIMSHPSPAREIAQAQSGLTISNLNNSRRGSNASSYHTAVGSHNTSNYPGGTSAQQIPVPVGGRNSVASGGNGGGGGGAGSVGSLSRSGSVGSGSAGSTKSKNSSRNGTGRGRKTGNRASFSQPSAADTANGNGNENGNSNPGVRSNSSVDNSFFPDMSESNKNSVDQTQGYGFPSVSTLPPLPASPHTIHPDGIYSSPEKAPAALLPPSASSAGASNQGSSLGTQDSSGDVTMKNGTKPPALTLPPSAMVSISMSSPSSQAQRSPASPSRLGSLPFPPIGSGPIPSGPLTSSAVRPIPRSYTGPQLLLSKKGRGPGGMKLNLGNLGGGSGFGGKPGGVPPTPGGGGQSITGSRGLGTPLGGGGVLSPMMNLETPGGPGGDDRDRWRKGLMERGLSGGFATSAAMPGGSAFFDNIRQDRENLSLQGILSNLVPLPLPSPDPEVRLRLPPFLINLLALSPIERMERIAREWFEIERSEQERLRSVMRMHSSESEVVDATNSPSRRVTNQVIGVPSDTLKSKTRDDQLSRFSKFGISAGVELGDRNRYTNIWPYEHSRVKLNSSRISSPSRFFPTMMAKSPSAPSVSTSPPMTKRSEPHLDYINASHIHIKGSTRHYIASQAPLRTTFEDFWTMVWQENVGVVVMLTLFHEGGREKCANYFGSGTYGPWKVELVQGRKEEKSTVGLDTSGGGGYFAFPVSLSKPDTPGDTIHFRTLELTNTRDPTQRRTIRHIQYVSWPDFDVPPDPNDVVRLISAVNDARKGYEHDVGRSKTAPVLVHCSAGVGRTGSFIIVDSVLDILQRQRKRVNSTFHHDDAVQKRYADRPSPRVRGASSPAAMQSTGMDLDIDPFSLLSAGNDGSALDTTEGEDSNMSIMPEETSPLLLRDTPIKPALEEMREQRMNMVANLRQYASVYECVLTGVTLQLKAEAKEKTEQEKVESGAG